MLSLTHFLLTPVLWFQAERVHGEGGGDGSSEAALRAGLHTYGQGVEARLRRTGVVHGL